MAEKGHDYICSCGSDKRFMHCCGKNNVLSLNNKIEKVLNNIQMDIFEYAMIQYESEIEEYLEQYYKNLTLTPEIKDMLHFFTATWLVSCVELDGKTIMAEYIDSFSYSLKGKRIKSLLQLWKHAQSSVSIIQSYDDSYVTVQDIFTKQMFRVKLFGDEATVQPGGILLGTILPAGETALFFTTYVEMPANISDRIVDAVLTLYEKKNKANEHAFISKHYPEVLSLFFFGPSDITVEGLYWNSTQQKNVALLFIDFMIEANRDGGNIDIGVQLWFQYCQRKDPSIKKPMIYVAALVYLINQHFPYEDIPTQKELAAEFDVSKNSISAKVAELETLLADELANLHYNMVNADGEYPSGLYRFSAEDVWEEEEVLDDETIGASEHHHENSSKIIPLKLATKHHDKR
ncbi:hypothetical protein [Niallia sp. 03133]|uniref:hypothetical protein n=1 Tax=Niallia sp. 03133 TaxID=3458060 RepID=UPI0040442582